MTGGRQHRNGRLMSFQDFMKRRSPRTKHAVTCIGFLDVTVADTTAEKEIEFRMEQTTDGKIKCQSVRFCFEVSLV